LGLGADIVMESISQVTPAVKIRASVWVNGSSVAQARPIRGVPPEGVGVFCYALSRRREGIRGVGSSVAEATPIRGVPPEGVGHRRQSTSWKASFAIPGPRGSHQQLSRSAGDRRTICKSDKRATLIVSTLGACPLETHSLTFEFKTQAS